MALHKDFPTDPHADIDPALRWYPGAAELSVEEAGKLLPPLVTELRIEVAKWRAGGYVGASATSRALLNHWFGQVHILQQSDGTTREFRYFFAQREAVETAVWLFEVAKARDPYSLMRYDTSGRLSKAMFPETWTRYVFKMATGAGKTKVLSLLIAWSYFHKLYETGSLLSRNFLLIAPNIIVLDRLRDDFDGLRIFRADPILPPNGHAGRNWSDDFQMTLHIQDEVGAVSAQGNLFLSNIHRVYTGDIASAVTDDDVSDYFLGSRPVNKTTANVLDLAQVVRSIDDLLVLNDEAHHIHDESLAWFRSIQDIDAKMRQRTGHGICAQLDVTATPKHDNGAIFVQTVSSYPLVEAIRQGVVKTPVVPDEASRAKLTEHPSDKISDRYSDHIKLGYLEWANRRDDLMAVGKKPILFVMTTTTAESDEAAEHLERTFPEMTGKVLVIHTNRSGEITEASSSGKAKDELARLREASRDIDSLDSRYLAVVSVMMLREGWDVQNVISMVGLRPYTASSEVLPEQTLGRGLRRMFRGDPSFKEFVSVVGTPAFLDFVDSIQSEGVELDRVPMGDTGTHQPQKPLVVEVDIADESKDLDALDIPLPRLASRITRETRNLDDLDPASMKHPAIKLQQFTEAQQREIVFKNLDTDKAEWATDLGEPVVATPQAVIAYLTKELMSRLRMVGGQDILYGKIKIFIRDYLFESPVDLDDLNVLRNLSEPAGRRALLETFAAAVNELTIVDSGTTHVVSEIRLTKTRPVVVNNQPHITSPKTVFNKVVGDSNLELRFAEFLGREDNGVEAFAKNTRSVHFFIEYVNASGEIAHYYPDFIVRTDPTTVLIVETKGLEDVDVDPKWRRLKQWCKDASVNDTRGRMFQPLYVTEKDFYDLEKDITSIGSLVDLLKDAEPLGTTNTAVES